MEKSKLTKLMLIISLLSITLTIAQANSMIPIHSSPTSLLPYTGKIFFAPLANLNQAIPQPTSQVILNSPLEGELSTTSPTAFNCTSRDKDGLQEISLWGNWSSNGWHQEEIKNISGRMNQTIFKVNLTYGVFEWNCKIKDSLGKETWARQNNTFKINNLTSRKLTYNPASPETGQFSPSGIEINKTTWIPMTTGEQKIGRERTTTKDAGIIFNLPEIEKYDHFTSARLVFASLGNSFNSTINLTISAIALDTIQDFSQANLPSTLEKTGNKVNWIIDSEWAEKEYTILFNYSSPNIAPIINEIISRSNWNQTNKRIALVIENNNPEEEEDNLIRNRFKREFLFLELSETILDTVQNREFMTSVTKDSALVSMMFTEKVDIYIEHGTFPGDYSKKTATQLNKEPYKLIKIPIENLTEDTKNYYRVRVRKSGEQENFMSLSERSFMTLRNKGSSFTFDVLTDSHLFLSLYEGTPQPYDGEKIIKKIIDQINADDPDFVLDGGDTAMTHRNTDFSALTQKGAEHRYQLVRNIYERLNSPLYLALGNHEGEVGWNSTAGDHIPGTQEKYLAARLRFWPNPTNETYSKGGGKFEDYYAFETGDALFVILDSYRYNTLAPQQPDDWTLGQEQLDWLNKTLRESDKKWKFLFSHHIIGGTRHHAGYNYGDGGGLLSQTGDQKVINHLMEKYNAQFYYYGHIHLFAHDWANWSDFNRENYTNYVGIGPSGGTGFCKPDRVALYDVPVKCEKGYLKTNVSPHNVTFAFINYSNGNPLYSYTLQNTPPIVQLVEPTNGSSLPGGEINFKFNYTDQEYDTGKNCTLIINNLPKKSQHGVPSGSITTYSSQVTKPGFHEWNMDCSDGALNTISQKYLLQIT